jgi:hypothetical protein
MRPRQGLVWEFYDDRLNDGIKSKLLIAFLLKSRAAKASKRTAAALSSRQLTPISQASIQ